MKPPPVDAVIQLIHRIEKQLSQDQLDALQSSATFLNQSSDLLSTFANYAGLLGTAQGPLAQLAAIPAVTVAGETAKLAELAQAEGVQFNQFVTTAEQALGQDLTDLGLGPDGTEEFLSAAAAAAKTEEDTAAVQAAGVSAAGAAMATVPAGIAVVAVVLVVSFILAELSGGGNSSQTEELKDLQTIITKLNGLEMNAITQHWEDEVNLITTAWIGAGQGGVGGDLDNLANEGTAPDPTLPPGAQTDVQRDVGHFHDHARAFASLFFAPTPGYTGFWTRPFMDEQFFIAEGVPYLVDLMLPTPPGIILSGGGSLSPALSMGWYGQLPQVSTAVGSMVPDPGTMLPMTLMALEAYFIIESVINFIDPAGQPTFVDFRDTWINELKKYASFLYSQYVLAVNGIVKTDIPGPDDMFTYLSFVAPESFKLFDDLGGIIGVGYSPPLPFYKLEGLQWANSPGCPSAGYMWNGVYGAVDAYPAYGIYQPAPPLPVPGASPGHVIDQMLAPGDLDTFAAESDAFVNGLKIIFAKSPGFMDLVLTDMVTGWMLPLIENRVRIGAMARWKAIYLLRRYDKVWTSLQHLYRVLKLDLGPGPIRLTQDKMQACGNWSMRELCSVLNTSGHIIDGIPSSIGGTSGSPSLEIQGFANNPLISANRGLGSLSLASLLQCYDNMALGNWVQSGYSTFGSGFRRPASFRSWLAAVAL